MGQGDSNEWQRIHFALFKGYLQPWLIWLEQYIHVCNNDGTTIK